ncbi:unnamed protein product [Gongylonema pulchrum]|uniref:Zinc finger, CCHC-type n=1 Tax=Gongylonema pulchrum TaxID=637853 RepID=A0A183DXG0_9BILA|nr:unnamed protein product [Gongylonema pulchrum]
MKPKKNDHFTVVMAPAPDKCSKPVETWKSWKESNKSETSIGAVRQQIKILFKEVVVKDDKETKQGALKASDEAVKGTSDGAQFLHFWCIHGYPSE